MPEMICRRHTDQLFLFERERERERALWQKVDSNFIIDQQVTIHGRLPFHRASREQGKATTDLQYLYGSTSRSRSAPRRLASMYLPTCIYWSHAPS